MNFKERLMSNFCQIFIRGPGQLLKIDSSGIKWNVVDTGISIIQRKGLQMLKRVLKSLKLDGGLGIHTIKATLKVHCRPCCFVLEQNHTLRSRDSFVVAVSQRSIPLKFLIIISLIAGFIIFFFYFPRTTLQKGFAV